MHKVNKIDHICIAVKDLDAARKQWEPILGKPAPDDPYVDEPEKIRGQRVLAVEDGPTLTHGEMKYGAGVLAAQRHGAAEIVDPRPYAVGRLKETFETYPGIGTLLPAMGYGEEQMKDLGETIARTPADVVLVATPIDLRRIIKIDKPALRVHYELQEIGKPDLEDVLARF